MKLKASILRKLRIMRKSSASLRNSGTYTSPGTPDYGDNNVGGTPKGWSSERVPLPTNNGRRHFNSPALMPFYSGRALPSKWDDAERWITSPVSGYGGVSKNSVVQPHRRPKSKSGPLGTPGLMYLSNYSPPMAALEGGMVRNFVAGSPFTTGVLLPDGISLQYGAYTGAKSSSVSAENYMEDQSCRVPQSSDLLSESSIPISQDGKPDGSKEAETNVSRRDIATQMSPDGSIHSSPDRRSPCSTFPLPIPSATDQHSNHSAKVEVRDVQVDKGTAFTRQYKKHAPQKTKRCLPDIQNSTPPLDVTQVAKNTSKLQREEAKITAWENLQKAKAETAIRKLEMKIEKRRSESMDKILNKLRVAERKAQEMRSFIAEGHAHERTSNNVAFFRRYVKLGSVSACFFRHTP